MSVAIIGGTGFIGSAVARRLVRRGLAPIVIARGLHPVALPAEAVLVNADRMDGAAIGAALRAHGVDTVIDIFALGLLNTAPVFAAMREIGGRYLLLSSVDVYSNYGGLLRREQPPVQLPPAREDDPLRSFRYPYRGNPRRPQGVDAVLFEDYDKILLEQAAFAEPRFAATAIRAPMIFGPGDKQHRFKWAIDAIAKGGVIAVDSRAAGWGNSYGYVDDVAEAIVVAALAPAAAGRVYNVGQNVVRTPVEWLHRFAAAMGKTIAIEIVPPEARGLLCERADASDLAYPLTLDTTRIRSELGYTEPTSENDALLATIAAETRA